MNTKYVPIDEKSAFADPLTPKSEVSFNKVLSFVLFRHRNIGTVK